jgi:hypothetical protein
MCILENSASRFAAFRRANSAARCSRIPSSTQVPRPHHTARARECRVGRYYDPATDQFLSVDPAVMETDQPYAIAGDDPINTFDPLGLESEKQFLEYLSHQPKSVVEYFERLAALNAEAIREYINDTPDKKAAKFVNSHKTEIILAPAVLAVGTVFCFFGGCEAVADASAGTVVNCLIFVSLCTGIFNQIEGDGTQEDVVPLLVEVERWSQRVQAAA